MSAGPSVPRWARATRSWSRPWTTRRTCHPGGRWPRTGTWWSGPSTSMPRMARSTSTSLATVLGPAHEARRRRHGLQRPGNHQPRRPHRGDGACARCPGVRGCRSLRAAHRRGRVHARCRPVGDLAIQVVRPPSQACCGQATACIDRLPAVQGASGPRSRRHGTPAFELIAGIGAAVDYLADLGGDASLGRRDALVRRWHIITAYEAGLGGALHGRSRRDPGPAPVGHHRCRGGSRNGRRPSDSRARGERRGRWPSGPRPGWHLQLGRSLLCPGAHRATGPGRNGWRPATGLRALQHRRQRWTEPWRRWRPSSAARVMRPMRLRALLGTAQGG